MQHLNQCPVKCRYCKLSETLDYGWSTDWRCTIGVLNESVGCYQEVFDCEKFEAKFDIVKSEHGIAIFDLEENKLTTPWVDYANKKLTCPKCQSIDWTVEEGIDWDVSDDDLKGIDTLDDDDFGTSFAPLKESAPPVKIDTDRLRVIAQQSFRYGAPLFGNVLALLLALGVIALSVGICIMLIIYFVKSYLGIDIFSQSHLFQR